MKYPKLTLLVFFYLLLGNIFGASTTINTNKGGDAPPSAALEIDSTEAGSKGYGLAQQGKWAEAVPLLEKAAQYDTNETWALWLGSCQMHTSNYLAASNTFSRYIELNPREANGYQWLGLTLYYASNYTGAAKAYREALRLNPFSPGLYYSYALALIAKPSAKLSVSKPRPALLSPQTPWARFRMHVWRGEPFKAWELYPWTMTISLLVVGGVCVLGTVLLWRAAFVWPRILRPGIFYFAAWYLYNMACQMFCAAVWPGGLIWGYCAGCLPIILAGCRAFPRAGWGAAYRWPKGTAFQWLAVGVPLVFVEMMFSGLFTAFLIYVLHITPTAPRNNAPIALMLHLSPSLAVLAVMGVAPLAEEILFRGLLFDAWRRRCGAWTILWTALVFGAAHFDPLYFVPLSALGAIMGWVRWMSGSIWPSFFLHAFVNGMGLALMVLSGQMQ